jgi:hypothetical protein
MRLNRLLPAALSLAVVAAVSPLTTVLRGEITTVPRGLGRALPARMPASHGGRTLFASPAGSGSSCTSKAPCALPTAWSRAQNGTVIVLRGGTYGLLDVEHRRFSPSNPVTMRSHRGETAVFVGSSSQPSLNAVALVDCEGIRIARVAFDARYNVANLKIDTSQHIEVNHVVSRDAGIANPQGGNGILVVSEPGYAHPFADDVQIWNSRIFNWGLDTTTLAGPHGIYYGAHGAQYGVIANNVIYDGPAGFGIQLGGDASNNIVANNTIVHMFRPSPGTGSAIVIWNDGYNLGTNDNVIVNNILADNVGYGIAAAGSPSRGNVVRSNLTYANSRGDYLGTFGDSRVFALHSPDYGADPRFVAPAVHNYRLGAGSPARGKADPAYAPPYDATGKPRPAAPALGAFG